MSSALKSRSNHYEVLGLAASASHEEVAEAFARQMRLPHLVSELAQIGIAFDTLRDPAKRRSYDQALGLAWEPKLPGSPAAMSFRVSARLAALASPEPIEASLGAGQWRRWPVSIDRVAKTEDGAEFVRQDAIGQPAQSQLVASAPIQCVVAEHPERLIGSSSNGLEVETLIEDVSHPLEMASVPRSFRWNRTPFVLGALVVLAMAIGAWAGAHSEDSNRTGKTASTKRSSPEVEAAIHRVTSTIPANLVAVAPEQIGHPATPAQSRKTPSPEASKSYPSADSSRFEGSVSNDTEKYPAAAQEHALRLPLSATVIARTIERIGYACGEIISATSLQGGGVYKINCSSGQSYQAKPVRGRYHFRRLEAR